MSYFVIIRGPLGIGKSTVAKKLAKSLGAEYVSIDAILDEHKLTEDKAKDGFISEKSFLRANELVISRVKKTLRSGKPVIFDGNFYRKSQIEDLIKNLKGKNYFVFTLKAPLKVCIKRDAGRKEPHGKVAAMVVYNITTKFDSGRVINVVDKTATQVAREIERNLPSI